MTNSPDCHGQERVTAHAELVWSTLIWGTLLMPPTVFDTVISAFIERVEGTKTATARKVKLLSFIASHINVYDNK